MKILFVCTGNICRSPTAEAMFRACVEKAGLEETIFCDSAGTYGDHTGENPDPRMVATVKKHGVDMGDLVARRVLLQDYDNFDVILAMDSGHLRHLQQNKPAQCKAELALYLPYAGIVHPRDVQDPYYEGPAVFEQVANLIAEASAKLLGKIRAGIGG